jgi:hypothetical protein
MRRSLICPPVSRAAMEEWIIPLLDGLLPFSKIVIDGNEFVPHRFSFDECGTEYIVAASMSL